ncbi:MAG: hypothetical protein CMF31_03735 [Kordiimonas sp.]|nr:hypothetical protein [Kordiimonas sp.]
MTEKIRGATIVNIQKKPAQLLSKGEQSRLRLIEAALKVFGRHSYANATTRMIAQEAGMNLGSIPYYFGSKEELNKAVASYVASKINEAMGPEMANAERLRRDKVTDKRELLNALNDLVSAILRWTISDDQSILVSHYAIREHMEPTAAYDVIHEQSTRIMQAHCAELVGAILGLPADSEEVIVRVSAIIGQTMSFTVAKVVVMRSADWGGYAPHNVAYIEKIVRQHTEIVLMALAGDIPTV